MHRNVRSSAQVGLVRTVVLSVALTALCGIALNSPASQAAAAETPPAPLGVASSESSFAGAQFADRKFGIDDNAHAGQTLATAAIPRQTDGMALPGEPDLQPALAEAPESLWQEQPVEDDGATFAAYEEPPAVVESAPDPEPAPQPEAAPAPEPEPVYEEPSYEEPVYEEPAVEWYEGLASAYSPACNGGTETASGIPLDWGTPTVASLWLPLGSYIEIGWGGMSVVAQVTDRGPYVGGRDLDLSPGVIAAFGFDSTDAWGVRSVSYRLL